MLSPFKPDVSELEANTLRIAKALEALVKILGDYAALNAATAQLRANTEALKTATENVTH